MEEKGDPQASRKQPETERANTREKLSNVYALLAVLALAGGAYLAFRVVGTLWTPWHAGAETNAEPRKPFSEIRFPAHVSPDQVDQAPFPDEPVLGLVVNGQARAYSSNQLSEQEMVSDEVGGVPVLVTY
jgi:hypothetical protein